jgi:hypothetical protein
VLSPVAAPTPGAPIPETPRVQYQTKVKLFVEGAPTEWIVGAIVCLYDRDRISRDDHLGTEITNMYGEASFRFTASQYMDVDERIGGTLPELYIEVFDSAGKRVITTRAQALPNEVPDLIRVSIERAIAERHGLL